MDLLKTAGEGGRSDGSARLWFMEGAYVGRRSPPAIDFQMHTQWTDGHSSVSEMIRSAHVKQLDAIAITEHVNKTSCWFPQFAAEVVAERQKFKELEVYHGAEIAAADYNGRLKADPRLLEAELVLGVVHRYPKPSGNGFWDFEELSRNDAVELEIRALKGLATNPHVDVLGHPGGTAFKKFGPFPVEWLEDVFCMARDNGMAVELNTKYLWDLSGMVALLQRVNPLVSFGSDAHQASDVGSNLGALTVDYTK